ncbi:Concanavalin A-like lectin/glucanases superfamily protein [Goodfellowiella coeruleoviolacea]|uniref:Concanavalin A-like lectin/glucanases superfamily protein n=1 Tax=Goodfellowiella coeruleoviolacea TaxID=334858 RepID=A0AAE3GE32_9PSEU|nr:Concanavalin A-like lectin/glucanases superfamily protein [Goodfellowiella coeruleoviolacea]
MQWQGSLPEPVLNGPTATYRDVLSDVDLVVRVSATGFSEVLVVKSAKAAANPELQRITFGSHTKGVTVTAANSAPAARAAADEPTPSGGLQAVDDKGVLVFGGDASRMWDSTGQTSETDPLEGPGENGRAAAMGVEVTDAAVAVIPDQDFLTDTSTRYPVYIDPEYWWAGGKNHHVVVQDVYPDQRNYDATGGDLNELKAGYSTENGRIVSRSFVEMNTDYVRGKIIHRATLRSTVIHSYSCSGGPTELWATNPISPDTTWRAQPDWAYVLGTITRANNARYCPSNGGADVDVTAFATQAANNGWTGLTFGMRAQNEGDLQSWRRFDLNPTLEIVYNSRPNAPTELGMEGGLIPCVRGENRPYVFTKTPRLRARLSDPDGGMLDAGFRVFRGTADNYTWDGNETHTGDVPSGSFAEVTVPSGVIPEDGTYTWHLWSGDYETSSWSELCEFTIDTTPPFAPAVTSTDYPYDTPAGGVGMTGTFVFSANGSSDVQHYLYSFTEEQADDPQTRVDASGLGGEATIRWTPSKEGPQTLFVRSVDRAGNKSDIVQYLVRIRSTPPGPVGYWKLDGDGADASGKSHPLTAAGSPNLTAEGYDGQAAGFDSADDELRGGTLLDTTKGFTVAAWTKLDRTGSFATVLSQDGQRAAGFFLQYSADDDRWAFAIPEGDRDDSSSARALSAAAPELGQWTHLVGSYDGESGELALYVNGVREGSATARSWTAAGDFVIGRGKWNGTAADQFPGTIDEVRAYQRVLPADEVALVANQGVLRAHYALNEGTGTQTTDEVTGQAAQLRGSATWSVDRYTAVEFTGEFGDQGGYVSAPRPAFRTDRSYTVSAWVRADDVTATARTAVSIGDPRFSPFLLQYRPENKQWALLVSCARDDSCGWYALSAGNAQAGQWVHLTGVYDAVSHEARLYVNGQFMGRATGVTGWNNDGELLIGRAQFSDSATDFWDGAVDDVKVFSGALIDNQINQLAIH